MQIRTEIETLAGLFQSAQPSLKAREKVGFITLVAERIYWRGLSRALLMGLVAICVVGCSTPVPIAEADAFIESVTRQAQIHPAPRLHSKYEEHIELASIVGSFRCNSSKYLNRHRTWKITEDDDRNVQIEETLRSECGGESRQRWRGRHDGRFLYIRVDNGQPATYFVFALVLNDPNIVVPAGSTKLKQSTDFLGTDTNFVHAFAWHTMYDLEDREYRHFQFGNYAVPVSAPRQSFFRHPHAVSKLFNDNLLTLTPFVAIPGDVSLTIAQSSVDPRVAERDAARERNNERALAAGIAAMRGGNSGPAASNDGLASSLRMAQQQNQIMAQGMADIQRAQAQREEARREQARREAAQQEAERQARQQAQQRLMAQQNQQAQSLETTRQQQQREAAAERAREDEARRAREEETRRQQEAQAATARREAERQQRERERQTEQQSQARLEADYLKAIKDGTRMKVISCYGDHYVSGERPRVKEPAGMSSCVNVAVTAWCPGDRSGRPVLARNFVGMAGCFGDTYKIEPRPSCKAEDMRVVVESVQSCP